MRKAGPNRARPALRGAMPVAVRPVPDKLRVAPVFPARLAACQVILVATIPSIIFLVRLALAVPAP